MCKVMQMVRTPEEKRARKRASNAAYMRRWRLTHAEVDRERCRRWREANPELVKQINQKAGLKYRQRDPVKYLAMKKAESVRNAATRKRYRRTHRAESSARCKRWTRNNPERVRIHRHNTKAVRRQRERNGADRAGCLKKIVALRKATQCHWCHCKIPEGRVTIDHVFPLSRGGLHVPANLVAACRPCNNRKSSRMPNEWLQEAA